jgi:hypothetical protein
MKTTEELKTTTGLLGHLADVMLKLEQRKITVDDAKAHASLVKQSNNLLRFELDTLKYKDKITQEIKN